MAGWAPKILVSSASFAEELWRHYGVPSSPEEAKRAVGFETVRMAPAQRGAMIGVGVLFIGLAVAIAYTEGGPFRSLLGSILEGGLFFGGLVAAASGAIGRVQRKVT